MSDTVIIRQSEAARAIADATGRKQASVYANLTRDYPRLLELATKRLGTSDGPPAWEFDAFADWFTSEFGRPLVYAHVEKEGESDE